LLPDPKLALPRKVKRFKYEVAFERFSIFGATLQSVLDAIERSQRKGDRESRQDVSLYQAHNTPRDTTSDVNAVVT
jgi:hypothetical protein